jgi:hypothetical protein
MPQPPVLPPPVPVSMLGMDDEANRNLRLHHHHQSLLGAPPGGEQLYSNLYGKDMGLMRKMMDMNEFPNGNQSYQSPPKTFPNYPNGQFNAKFATPQNYGFPFDKVVHSPGQMRHEGLLKPCYDFPKMEAPENPLMDGFPAYKKQSPIMGQTFMNQYPDFHANNFGGKSNSCEINNNGIVLKMENGGPTTTNSNDFNNAMQISNKTSDILCSRSSTINMNATNKKIEPNEFNTNLNNNKSSNNDNDDPLADEDNKSSLNGEESNDGFTNL